MTALRSILRHAPRVVTFTSRHHCLPSRVHSFPARRLLSQDKSPHQHQRTSPSTPNDNSTSSPSRPSSIMRDIREHADKLQQGEATQFDSALIPIASANLFPRIKTTSLSTKRIVIPDEAAKSAVTLVLVAFRSFADDQLHPWRDAFISAADHDGAWFDVTVNESFGAQALSGFVQRWQRTRTDPSLHDYYVAFNNYAREPLEVLLLTSNRMFGNMLLLDREGRVRFRAAGAPSSEGVKILQTCIQQLIQEDTASQQPS